MRPVVEEHQLAPAIASSSSSSSAAAAAAAAEALDTSLYDSLSTDPELNPEVVYDEMML